MGNHYNGYSWDQREAILRETKRLAKIGDDVALSYLNSGAPCAICADPGKQRPPPQWHSEDYSAPFLLAPPATYILCETCHSRLHKRFPKPDGVPTDWPLYALFLNTGGYGREFTQLFSLKQRNQMLTSLLIGDQVRFAQVRARQLTGREWWQRLSLDPESLVAAWARPRPLRPRPPIDAYREALARIAPTPKEFALLKAHANAPFRRLTMRDAALAVDQRPVPSIANLAYGSLARRLALAMQWQPDMRSDGSPIWMTVVAEGWKPLKREFEWILVPQLVELYEGS